MLDAPVSGRDVEFIGAHKAADREQSVEQRPIAPKSAGLLRA
jgi:hypothetical protein